MGRLRVPAENLEANLEFIREYLDDVSAPKPERLSGGRPAQFYEVDFRATPAVWGTVRFELNRRGIDITLYENPDLSLQVEAKQERLLEKSKRRGNLQLIRMVGFLFILGGIVSMLVTGKFLVPLGIALLGLIVVIVARIVLDYVEEETEGWWRIGRRGR
jgi:hypothetical protein